jgi:glycosyltransferase involved in cell wall biosynthesis
MLALLKKILGLSTPRQIILELMLDEEREAFLWRVKKRIQEAIFSKTDLIFVSSKSEVTTYSERLRLPESRIRFVPFHTNIVEPRVVQGKGNYLFSAGKTGRDFDVLIQAVRNVDCQLMIVSDRDNIPSLEIPSNIKLLIDIPYPKYLELLFDCRAVIVPLKRLVKSTGQVVILEAMALGKPVIASETVGTVDYIKSGMNGILVPPGDAESLNTAISRVLTDADFCRNLSENALQTVKEFHTFDIYVDTVLKAASELATQ